MAKRPSKRVLRAARAAKRKREAARRAETLAVRPRVGNVTAVSREWEHGGPAKTPAMRSLQERAIIGERVATANSQRQANTAAAKARNKLRRRKRAHGRPVGAPTRRVA